MVFEYIHPNAVLIVSQSANLYLYVPPESGNTLQQLTVSPMYSFTVGATTYYVYRIFIAKGGKPGQEFTIVVDPSTGEQKIFVPWNFLLEWSAPTNIVTSFNRG